MSRPTRGSLPVITRTGLSPALARLSRRFRLPDMTTGLVRVRSPLLAESRLMSFPPATEMFQFPGFASPTYGFSGRYRRSGGLPHSEIHGSKVLAAPRGFSQRATSFIASQCQGIHQMPFRRLISHIRSPPQMRHAQEQSLTQELNHQPADASGKDASHDPTDAPHCRGDGPVGSSSVTHSLHMSKIPYPPTNGYLLSLHRISTMTWSCSGHCPSLCHPPGGGDRDRTDDLLLAKQALSQLSYAPIGDRIRWNSGGPGRT